MSNQTPGEDQAQVNSVPWTNGKGLVTGATIMALLTAIIGTFYLYGPLSGTNVWTGTNAFNGAITFGDPSSARANLGAAAADGSSPFTATGAGSVAAITDRATFKGVSFDARSDFGFACDGVTDDTTKMSAMVTAINASPYAAVRMFFPGSCLIKWQNWTITKPTWFEGVSGGGLKIASGQTLSSYLFRWLPPTTSAPLDGVTIRNLSIDLNNNPVSATGVTSVLNFFDNGAGTFGLSNLTVEDSHIFNAGSLPTGATFEEIFAYSVNGAKIHHNTFQINIASDQGNEAFDAGAQNRVMTDLDFSDNTLINTGFGVFGVAGQTTIHGNRVSGWGFGAGITAETVGYTDSAIKNMVVSGNSIKNSLAALDHLGTKLDGIEIGFAGAVIEGNSIYSTCGVGIGFYGGSDLISNNNIGDAGTCNVSDHYNSGIASLAPPGRPAAYTLISGNAVYEDGGGNTSYGFSDVQPVDQIRLGVNDFHGLKGAYNLALTGGGIEFLAAQSDNRIVNPCGQIDQRNAGTAVTVGSKFGPDQWKLTSSVGNVFSLGQIQTQSVQCYYALKATVVTQVTPGAGDLYKFQQQIALQDVRDFAYGNPLSKDGVLAFCATYSGSPPFTTSVYVYNVNGIYTITKQFTITAGSGVWQCFSFNIPADSNSLGTTPSAAAFRVGFNLGSGSSSLTTPGIWTAGNFAGSTGDMDLVSQPAGTTLKFSDIRFFPAGADEGWAPPTYAQMLVNAQRFYRTSFPVGTAPVQNAGVAGASCVNGANPSIFIPLNPPMNAGGTLTTYNPSAANANWRDTTAGSDLTAVVPTGASAGAPSTSGAFIGSSTATAGTDISCIQWAIDAGL